MSSSSFHLCRCATHVCLPEPWGHLCSASTSHALFGPSMLLSHTLQLPTQRLHVSVLLFSSYLALKEGDEGESKGVLFSRLIPDAGRPLVLLEAVLQTVTAVCISFTRNKTVQNFYQLSLHPDLLASAGTLAIAQNDSVALTRVC